MKKRNKKFNPNKHLVARPPMLVMREIVNTELETKELAAVMAFKYGAATHQHWELLLDMTNLLLLAGTSDKSREYATKVAERHFLPALHGIKNRYDRVGKLGTTSQENRILAELIEFSKQFWNRQPIELFDISTRELSAYYKSLKTEEVIHYASN